MLRTLVTRIIRCVSNVARRASSTEIALLLSKIMKIAVVEEGASTAQQVLLGNSPQLCK